MRNPALDPLPETLLAAINLANTSATTAYKAGHEAGYRLGFIEGIAAARKIVDEHFAGIDAPVTLTGQAE